MKRTCKVLDDRFALKILAALFIFAALSGVDGVRAEALEWGPETRAAYEQKAAEAVALEKHLAKLIGMLDEPVMSKLALLRALTDYMESVREVGRLEGNAEMARFFPEFLEEEAKDCHARLIKLSVQPGPRDFHTLEVMQHLITRLQKHQRYNPTAT